MPQDDVVSLPLTTAIIILLSFVLFLSLFSSLSPPLHAGDIMSPPDLDRLLVLPYGCGEQNMVRTGLNWVVAVYLQSTGQLSDHIAIKIRQNLITGERCTEIVIEE